MGHAHASYSSPPISERRSDRGLTKGYALPSRQGSLGSVVSSPSGRVGAPAVIEFDELFKPKFDFWQDEIK